MEFAKSNNNDMLLLYKTFDGANLDFIVNEYDLSTQQFVNRYNDADQVLDDMSIPFNSPFTLFRSGEIVNFQKRFSPYIYSYHLTENKFKKRLYIDTDFIPSLEFVKKVTLDPALLYADKSHVFIKDITSIFETDHLLFLNVYMNTKTVKVLLDKKTGDVGYYDDLAKGVLTNGVIYGVCGDSFISAYTDFVDREDFLNTLSSLHMTPLEKEPLKMLSHTDNPILTILTFDNILHD